MSSTKSVGVEQSTGVECADAGGAGFCVMEGAGESSAAISSNGVV
jgi:hypothetical protein